MNPASLWNSGDPLVTVYIPTYQRRDILMKRALSSVLAQTYKNLEIIVAAHGCTDGTQESIRSLPYRRLKLLEVPRTRTYPPTAENHWLAGPVAPANAALAAAKGRWVMRIDDDDVLKPNCIGTLLRNAQEGDFEYISAAHETHEGKIGPYDMDGVKVGGIQTTLYRSYLRFMKFNPYCYLKADFRVNDVDLQRRMVRAGVRMGYLDYVVCTILPRPGETEIGSKAYLDDAKTVERYLEF
jgi:glycosyltransferase involved in cell wall biosynthesis